MYLEHFGLAVSPFSISPRLDFLYRSGAFEESMAHLVYGLDNSEAIVMITGAIGTGKTMAIQSFLSHLGDRYQSALVTNTCVDGRELLKLILDDLGALPEVAADKSDLLIAFKKFLIGAGRDGKRIVIIIDEAQNLSREVLEEIRQLTNLGQGEEQPVQVILVGQPELEEAVQRADLAQLKQRIRVHYKLAPLSRRELEEYVDHRMEVAGGKRGAFGARALDRIFEQSGGVPRVVNTLCSDALLSAFVAGRSKVEVADLEEWLAAPDVVESGKPAARAESALPPPRAEPMAAAAAARPEAAAVKEARDVPSARREDRAAPKPAREEPFARKRVRGRSRIGGAWAVVALVVGLVAVMAFTGRLDGLWSRLPFVAGAGTQVEGRGDEPTGAAGPVAIPASTDVASRPSPVVTTADSLQHARAETGAETGDSQLPVAGTAAADTTPAAATRRAEPEPRAAVPAPQPTTTSVASAVEAAGVADQASTADGEWYIHVSSFRTAGQAAAVAKEFTESGLLAGVREQTVRDVHWYRVYLGPYGTHDDAVHLANRLRDEGTITYYKAVRSEAGEGP